MKKIYISLALILGLQMSAYAITPDTSGNLQKKVKVSSNDTTSGYLNGKLVAGSNITFTESNDGGNETLIVTASVTGSGVNLDLTDDDVNESTGLSEIATTGDTNNIFTEPIANKLLFDLTKDWPKSDQADALAANGTNCASTFAPLGVDASGNAESCFDVPTQTEYDAHVAATAAHGATGAVVGTTNSQTLTFKTIEGGDGGTSATRISGSNLIAVRSHNTDCTLLADGIANEICYEEDDEDLYICEPSIGICDSVPEWKSLSAASTGYNTVEDETTPLTQRTTIGFTGAGVSCADSGGETVCTIPGSGSATISVDEADVLVDGSTTTLDFRAGFDVTSSPAGEANIFLDFSEVVTGDVLFDTSNVATIQANSVALTTDTTGDYLANVTCGTTLTGCAAGSEGQNPTLSVADDSIDGAKLADNLTIDGTGLKLGDAGSNYTQFGTNGAITYAGTAKPARTIILTATGATMPSTNFPASATIDGTNVDYKVLDFDDSTDESIYYTFQWPDGWDSGNLTPVVNWQSTSTTNNVVWAVQVACVADDEAVDASLGSDQSVTDAAKGTANRRNEGSISAFTPSGCAAGELTHIKIRRDADNGSDTMTGDARYLFTKLEFISNAESD